MHKLPAVEEAKRLMEEAKGWSLWGWLMEKRRLRRTADEAWAALEQEEKRIRALWSGELKEAARHPGGKDVDPEMSTVLERLKEADQEAHSAHMQAEETFDEADRRMSTSMAREGAQQAIDAWGMREKVIRKAEAIGRRVAGAAR